MDYGFKGKIALVTGAGSEVGMGNAMRDCWVQSRKPTQKGNTGVTRERKTDLAVPQALHHLQPALSKTFPS